MAFCYGCNGEYPGVISKNHLYRAHKLSPSAYLAKYEKATSEDLRVRRYNQGRKVCLREGCERFTAEKKNDHCSYECSMSNRMSKDGRNEQAGNTNSLDHGWYAIEDRNILLAKERDKWTCQVCFEVLKAQDCQAHHIIPKRWFKITEVHKAHDLSNLITLCGRHHKKFETLSFMFAYDEFLPTDAHVENFRNILKKRIRDLGDDEDRFDLDTPWKTYLNERLPKLVK